MTTPAMAPNGLKACDKFKRRVAVLSGPIAKTYELADVSKTESPAKRIKIANRYIKKLTSILISELSIAG